jgi:hypothetical protein
MSTAIDPSTPVFLSVLRGQPTDTELAVVVAVLAARGASAAAQSTSPPASRSEWANKARLLRRPIPHGPGAWHLSQLP